MTNKITRGNASQFHVAAELCRRGYSAVITLGNCPHTDVFCSDIEGKRFVHIQVKTFRPGDRTCTVGAKADIDYGPRFFWVLVGLPIDESAPVEELYVIPSSAMAKNMSESYKIFMATPGKNGKKHKENTMRNVHLPPRKSGNGWSVKRYLRKWELLEKKLTPTKH